MDRRGGAAHVNRTIPLTEIGGEMETESNTGKSLTATVVMWTALGVAIVALLLWLLNVIGPPAGIIGGATAIVILLGAGRYRKKTG